MQHSNVLAFIWITWVVVFDVKLDHQCVISSWKVWYSLVLYVEHVLVATKLHMDIGAGFNISGSKLQR